LIYPALWINSFAAGLIGGREEWATRVGTIGVVGIFALEAIVNALIVGSLRRRVERRPQNPR
jgi:hypothetical protein